MLLISLQLDFFVLSCSIHKLNKDVCTASNYLEYDAFLLPVLHLPLSSQDHGGRPLTADMIHSIMHCENIASVHGLIGDPRLGFHRLIVRL